ncbi:MAG: hypothetical protein HY445_00670 [Candidatus Niyogibacteria bacterium]|nr:hypothetical protein [Candidatus Niyogibacteria bacterium]
MEHMEPFLEKYPKSSGREGEDFEQLRHAFEALEDAETAEEKRRIVAETYQDITSAAREHQFPIFSFPDFWRKAQERGLLLRRDAPERIFESLLDKKDVQLGKEITYYQYANATDDTTEGLRTALMEGLGGDEIVTVYGFDAKGTDVQRIKKSDEDPRAPKRFIHLRSVKGVLHPSQIKYVIIRIPTKLFPAEELNEFELGKIEEGKSPPYVFRIINTSIPLKPAH